MPIASGAPIERAAPPAVRRAAPKCGEKHSQQAKLDCHHRLTGQDREAQDDAREHRTLSGRAPDEREVREEQRDNPTRRRKRRERQGRARNGRGRGEDRRGERRKAQASQPGIDEQRKRQGRSHEAGAHGGGEGAQKKEPCRRKEDGMVRVRGHRNSAADRRVPQRRGSVADRLRKREPQRREEESEVPRIKNEAAENRAAPERQRPENEEPDGEAVPPGLQNSYLFVSTVT